MLDPIVENRIAELDPNYVDFVFGNESVKATDQYAEINQLNENKSAVLENGVVLFLLFFLDKPDLKDFFTNEGELNAEEAELLVEEVIMSLPDNIKNFHENNRKLIFENKKAEEESPVILSSPESLTPKILEDKMRDVNTDENNIKTIKDSLITYLSNQNISDTEKDIWIQWSKNSVFGLQFDLNDKLSDVKINWKKFQDGYKKATSTTKELIDNRAIIDCIDIIISRYSIPLDLKDEFALIYTYMILDIKKEQEIIDFINNKVKPEAGADVIFSSLLICLTKVNKKTSSEPKNNEGTVNKWETDTLPTLRTMENDEKRSTG